MKRIEVFSDDLLYMDIVNGAIIVCRKSRWIKLKKDLPPPDYFDSHKYKSAISAFNRAITLQRLDFTLNKANRISSIMKLTALKQDNETLVNIKKSLFLSKLFHGNFIKIEKLISGLMRIEK